MQIKRYCFLASTNNLTFGVVEIYDEIESKYKYYMKCLNATTIHNDINKIVNYGNTLDDNIGLTILNKYGDEYDS